MRTVRIQLAMESGDVTVKALRYGAFAIHRRMALGATGTPVQSDIGWPWVVTHIPSGRTAGWRGAPSREAALCVARRLSRLPIPWREVKPLAKVSRKLRTQAERIAKSEAAV